MLDAYRDLIDELLGTPSEIRSMIAETSDPATARQLVAELRDRDRAVLKRLQTMTRQESPYLRVLSLDAAVDAAAVDDDALDSLLADMDTARGDLVSLLMNLSLKDWEKTAIHETEGEITLADEVESHVEFDEAHLDRFRELIS